MRKVVTIVYGFNITAAMEADVFNRLQSTFESFEVRSAIADKYLGDIEAFCELPGKRAKYRPTAVIDRIADRLIQRWKHAQYVIQSSRGHWDRLTPKLDPERA